MLLGFHAYAVPWCHKGTVVTVANVNWNGATNVAMSSGIPVPPNISDPERFQVFHSTHNYCSAYSGGGGPTWPGSPSGVGSVITVTTGPNVLTNTVNDYSLEMGVSFLCKKCYAIPPYQVHKELERYEPMIGTEGNDEYNEVIRDK